MAPTASEPDRPGLVSRRSLLIGAGAALGAGAVGLGAGALGTRALGAVDDPPHGSTTIPFHGPHQPGVITPPPAHASLVALDLRAGVDRDAMRRLLRLLSDDGAQLMAGRPVLADLEPELGERPAALTVTVGLGAGAVERIAPAARPAWLAPLPAFSIDRLEPARSDGDVLLQLCSDDPMALAHARRVLERTARAFATPRWRMDGFRRAHGSATEGTPMRNLFGQVDESANLRPGDPDLERAVWIADGPLAGGTAMVVRRIRLDLGAWDAVDRRSRELAVGRRLGDGAPITGGRERDDVDLEHRGELGLPTVQPGAHVRRARAAAPEDRMLRRSWNVDDGDPALAFVAFQADPLRQFVPVQQRLADLDLLNLWTTPIGSAVFAVPPGCEPGGFVGETLFD
ncbi:Dyp-type peroxidase [Agrococcus sp. BE272]|uniref:Dyp-type peroxidase n=1 Tax=Agrococcus sp. BE272 TaxID=2817727 RepID=UPI00285B93ED|nr:Dyp-type peroxidase [Agrococcus sp. BE272]MDR7233037.1 dye decolorizing peroxidase [Agrococcus sp. BE272]